MLVMNPSESWAAGALFEHLKEHKLPLSILMLFSAPFSLPALRGFFTFDDLMNLYYYSSRPLGDLFGSIVNFWIPYRRPLGGVVYLSLFQLFGLTAWPYYLFGILVFSANLVLLYFLIFRLTRSAPLSVTASALAGIHAETATVLYNFGSLYELLALGFMLASFHLYLSYLGAGSSRARLYGASLAAFLLALGSKEMAVTTPLVLALYELVYRIPAASLPRSIGALAKRLAPFFLLAGLFSLAKIQVAEVQWEGNPAYAYHFGEQMYHNLHGYLDLIFLQAVRFNDSRLAWTLVGTLALALFMRNRHMIFGWSIFLILLLPVLGLPRLWGLFLYIPLIGLGLYVAAFLFQGGRWIGRRALTGLLETWQFRSNATYAGLAIFLVVLALSWHAPFSRYRDLHFLDPARERRQFATQLFSTHPSMPETAVLLFEGSPFDSWDLNFLVWLGYGSREIRILRAPEELGQFETARRQAPHAYVFRYSQGLLEMDPEASLPETYR